MDMNWMVFACFNLFVIAMLVIDLGVFHRRSHVVSVRETLSWSVLWISLALEFNALILFSPGWLFTDAQVAQAVARGELAAGAGLAEYGHLRAEQFLAGFLIEKSLAVDNLFVFLLIFLAFAVPAVYQHKLLFYGIVGALILRAGFIFGGVALIQTFTWIIYIFGVFLVFTGIKMLLPQKPMDPANHWLIKFSRRILPVTDDLRGDRFFVSENGKRMVTPLFLVLVHIEFTDVVFAVDSIPAILAITDDAFIVHRVYLKCLCDSWFALAVLCSRGNDGSLPLLKVRFVGHLNVCRRKNARACDHGGINDHGSRLQCYNL